MPVDGYVTQTTEDNHNYEGHTPQDSRTSPLLDLVRLQQPGAVTSTVYVYYISIWKDTASLELGTSNNSSYHYKYSQLLLITQSKKYVSQYKATWTILIFWWSFSTGTHIWHMLSCLGHSYLFSGFLSFIFLDFSFSVTPPFPKYFVYLNALLLSHKLWSLSLNTSISTTFYWDLSNIVIAAAFVNPKLSLQTAESCWLLLLLPPFSSPFFPPRSLFEMPLICRINSTFGCVNLRSHFWAQLNFNKVIKKKWNYHMPAPSPSTHITFLPSFICLKADKHTVCISILAQRYTTELFASPMTGSWKSYFLLICLHWS